MNKNTTILIAILTIGIALAYWKREWIMTRIGLRKSEPLPAPLPNNIPNSSGTTWNEWTSGPVVKGHKGAHVETIQKLLNHVHDAGLLVDGYFGDKTEQALIDNGYGESVEKEDVQRMRTLLSG